MRNRIVLIVDIDGTVVDSMGCVQEISNKTGGDTPDWWNKNQIDEFMEGVDSDPVIPGAQMLSKIARKMGADIVFLTGRSECYRMTTSLWIKNNLGIEVDIPPHIYIKGGNVSIPLYMRSDGDFRPGFMVKSEILVTNILPKYKNEQLVFLDDDPKCLEVYGIFGVALKAPYCWDALCGGNEEHINTGECDPSRKK